MDTAVHRNRGGVDRVRGRTRRHYNRSSWRRPAWRRRSAVHVAVCLRIVGGRVESAAAYTRHTNISARVWKCVCAIGSVVVNYIAAGIARTRTSGKTYLFGGIECQITRSSVSGKSALYAVYKLVLFVVTERARRDLAEVWPVHLHGIAGIDSDSKPKSRSSGV